MSVVLSPKPLPIKASPLLSPPKHLARGLCLLFCLDKDIKFIVTHNGDVFNLLLVTPQQPSNSISASGPSIHPWGSHRTPIRFFRSHLPTVGLQGSNTLLLVRYTHFHSPWWVLLSQDAQAGPTPAHLKLHWLQPNTENFLPLSNCPGRIPCC